MSSNGNKIELPSSIVIRDLAQIVGKSPIDLIKKLMTNGVMATINQSVDFDTAAIVVAEYGFEAVPEVVEEVLVETGEVPLWRRLISGVLYCSIISNSVGTSGIFGFRCREVCSMMRTIPVRYQVTNGSRAKNAATVMARHCASPLSMAKSISAPPG